MDAPRASESTSYRRTGGSAWFPEWVATYEKALSLYRAGHFGAALKKLNAVEKLSPGDGPARRLEHPLPRPLRGAAVASWIPVTMLDTK